MPAVFIQAPTEKVFEAMCDLKRHSAWAPNDLTIEAGQEGPPQVGHTYTSSAGGKAPDRLTITEMKPNESFRFHSVLANNWEFDFQMTVSPQGEGSRVTRSGRMTKAPWFLSPMKLLVAAVGPIPDKKLLNGMKSDLESND